MTDVVWARLHELREKQCATLKRMQQRRLSKATRSDLNELISTHNALVVEAWRGELRARFAENRVDWKARLALQLAAPAGNA